MQDFTAGSDTSPGKRNQAEEREEGPVAPCTVESSRFWDCALCRSWGIMQNLFAHPPCQEQRALWGQDSLGGTSAATQMVTPGLQPPGEDIP